jgi:hypothetical protein
VATDQDGFLGALLEAHDGAKDDRMGMALDDLFDQAVERGDRIGEHRGAGRERRPLRRVETVSPMHAAVPAEAMGEGLMARGEQADGESACLAQSGERRGQASEAYEEGRRGQRQGRKRGGRAAGARFVLSAGDNRDPRGEGSHSVPKGVAVGVAQSPVAHVRAPTSRLAKAGVNMQDPQGAFRPGADRQTTGGP